LTAAGALSQTPFKKLAALPRCPLSKFRKKALSKIGKITRK